jgi:hypothetical protein
MILNILKQTFKSWEMAYKNGKNEAAASRIFIH